MQDKPKSDSVHLAAPCGDVPSAAPLHASRAADRSELPVRPKGGKAYLANQLKQAGASEHTYGENCRKCDGGYCLAFPNWSKK